jgi:hypothetical protein
MNSNFKNSRFCRGLIVHRKPLFIPQKTSLINYTHIFMTPKTNQDKTSFITIASSTFTALNMYTNVTALATYGGTTPNKTLYVDGQLEALTYPAFLHRGIIINSEDFGGSIEVASSTVTKNIHYFPEAANMPRDPQIPTGIE